MRMLIWTASDYVSEFRSAILGDVQFAVELPAFSGTLELLA
jgi:hypothetical protein